MFGLAANAVLGDQRVDEDASIGGLGLDGEGDAVAIEFTDEVSRGSSLEAALGFLFLESAEVDTECVDGS